MITRQLSASVAAQAAACALAAAASAQSLPIDVVEQAIGAAESRAEPDQRWAFTSTVTANGARLSARYDPSRPAGEEWTLIEPAGEDALSDEQRAVLNGLRRQAEADRQLMVEGARQDYGVRPYVREGLALSDESATEKRYAFRPVDDVGLTSPPDSNGPKMAEHLSGELVIATSEPMLAEVRLHATESFKPNAAARINALDLAWRFGEVEPGGPIAILGSDTRASGRALFRGFDVTSTVENSDFTRVEVPAARAE